MNVQELMAALDEYGGHLPVIVRHEEEDEETGDLTVEYGSDEDGTHCVLIIV